MYSLYLCPKDSLPPIGRMNINSKGMNATLQEYMVPQKYLKGHYLHTWLLPAVYTLFLPNMKQNYFVSPPHTNNVLEFHKMDGI